MVATAPSVAAGPSAQGRSASRIASDRLAPIRGALQNDVFRRLEHRHLDRRVATFCIGRARPHRRNAHRERCRFSRQTRGGRYCRARYYHPDLQRFISEDPIGFLGGDPNLYSYVFNRPTVLTDPLGLQYKDLNISVGYGVGVTFGVLVEGNKIYPYLGGGLMTPGIGASLTASPSSVTQGWQVGLQGAAGVAGQVGYSFGTGGGWFWEAGIGGGWPTFAGGSLTGYYVFGPASSSRAMATSLQSPAALLSEPPTPLLAAPKMSGRK